MSEKLANQYNLIIGQKVLYPNRIGSNSYGPIYMEIVTVKDVVTNYDDEDVLITEEHEGYLSLSSIWTKDSIDKLFLTKEIWCDEDNEL